MKEAALWAWKRTSRRIRFFEQDGSPADGLVVREWADGTIVALDLMCDAPRRLVAESGEIRRLCEIQPRGVMVLGPGELPPGATQRGRLEITVYTHVLNIFGDHDRPGAKWDMKFWNPQHDADSTLGLFVD